MTILLGSLISAAEWAPGDGVVTGTVYDKASPTNTPIVERVFLRRRIDHVLIDTRLSGEDGRYTFRYVDRRYEYYVYSLDRHRVYDPDARDGIIPDLMA